MKVYFLMLAAPFFLSVAQGALQTAIPHKAKPHQAVARPKAAVPFRDVPPNHWAAKAVETLQQAGIVQGEPPKTKGKAP